MTYTVAQAKSRLPELIKQVKAGARVTITKRGIPVVEIIRKVEDSGRKPVFGVLGDKKIVLDTDWARPQENIDAWLPVTFNAGSGTARYSRHRRHC